MDFMKTPSMTFHKMNGLGNDFAVFDARGEPVAIGPEAARQIADRSNGIGCDQVVVLEPSTRADVFMRILNADGSEVSACGNATRCIAGLISEELGKTGIAIETAAGVLSAAILDGGLVMVDMGEPRFDWSEIPLARDMSTKALDFAVAVDGMPPLDFASAVNVGNPHCIFWVDDATGYDLGSVGPRVETDALFPERVNVSLAQVTSSSSILLRVWERGAGLTRACGTAACAAGVAAARNSLTGRKVSVSLPGGDLLIHWRECDNRIHMTGPWTLEYTAEAPSHLFGEAPGVNLQT